MQTLVERENFLGRPLAFGDIHHKGGNLFFRAWEEGVPPADEVGSSFIIATMMAAGTMKKNAMKNQAFQLRPLRRAALATSHASGLSTSTNMTM